MTRSGYSEKEFALILAKASELAESRSGSRDPSGLSLEEIKAIAAEVGLDAELVARAAGLVALEAEPSTAERLIGGPLRYRAGIHRPTKLTEEGAARLLAAVRSQLEQQGEGTVDAAGMSWHTVGEGSQIMVTAHGDGDETHVRVVADRSGALAVAGTFTLLGTLASGIVVLVAGKMGAYESALAGLTLFGVAGSGVLALARGLWQSTGETLKRRVAALQDLIERALTGEEPDA